MSQRVFITGIGIISALGAGSQENREKLIKGETGIKKAQFLQSRYTETLPFGEISFSTTDLQKRASILETSSISRTETLALIAFQQCIKDANLSPEDIQSKSTALMSASTVGGMSATDEMFNDAQKDSSPSPLVASYNVGEHTNGLLKRHGMKGLSSTFNTACSSSANAIMLGAKLIKSGRCTRVIAGGADALAKFTVNGFNSLQILSDKHCKPFSEDRKGLNLGEGAAYLVLEAENVVGDKKVYAEVKGYGNANDAYHPSSMSDEATGITKAIEGALTSAKLKWSDIDYINAHGTGTENNDITEQTGLNKLFEKVPPFQSTKTYTGHTLAAAGAIEAVFSILSMEHAELYPSLNCDQPIKEYGLKPIEKFEKGRNIKHILSNSFGFGGNCSSILLSKV